MFDALLLHAVYAVLMYAFSFRIMVVPHAIAVALMGIYMIFGKGLIIAPILSFIYSFFAILLATTDEADWDDGTGNEFIYFWVIFCSGLSYVIFEYLY